MITGNIIKHPCDHKLKVIHINIVMYQIGLFDRWHPRCALICKTKLEKVLMENYRVNDSFKSIPLMIIL